MPSLLPSVLVAFDPTSNYHFDDGSKNRTKEEVIMLNWSQYVNECEEKGMSVQIETSPLTYSLLYVYFRRSADCWFWLQLFTGPRRVPACGFETPLKIHLSMHVAEGFHL